MFRTTPHVQNQLVIVLSEQFMCMLYLKKKELDTQFFEECVSVQEATAQRAVNTLIKAVLLNISKI